MREEEAIKFALAARDREEPVAGPDPIVPGPAEVIRARKAIGVAVPTGIPTLDRRTRGGIPPGRSVVFGAPPGLGKTSLLVQTLTSMAMRGLTVAGLFADEGRDAAAVRVGQNLGFERFRLEAGDEETARGLEEKLEGCRFLLPDSDAEDVTVESVGRLAREHGEKGRPVVLGFDSIQTVRSETAEAERDPRLSVKRTASAIQRLKKPLDAIVLAVSEVNRGAYRAKKEVDRVTPLSSFSESSRIEYAFDVAVFIDGDPEDEIQLRIVKNRLGPKGKPFHMRFCERTAKFTEIDAEERERSRRTEEEVLERERLEKPKPAIREELRKHKEGLSTAELRELLGLRNALVVDVLRSLERDGEVENVRVPGPGRGRRWRFREKAEAGDGSGRE